MNFAGQAVKWDVGRRLYIWHWRLTLGITRSELFNTSFNIFVFFWQKKIHHIIVFFSTIKNLLILKIFTF